MYDYIQTVYRSYILPCIDYSIIALTRAKNCPTKDRRNTMNKQTITPYMFEGFLIISLDNKWIDAFGKIPTFEISIDKENYLHLISL